MNIREEALATTFDLLEAGRVYTKDEIQATIESVQEQIIEDARETFLDRYPVRTQQMSTAELLTEVTRLEMKDDLDRFDNCRYNFVKAELAQRQMYGNV
jgi:hypothetical protein